MTFFHSVLAIAFICIALTESNAQSDVPSKSDQLIVAAHKSIKFGDVVSARNFFPKIDASNVSFQLTQKKGIHLTLLTRFPMKYAEQLSKLRKNSVINTSIGLPPLAQNDFSFAKLKAFRAKNGVAVFLCANWCATCVSLEKESLPSQSLLKLLYDSNVPILKADFTNSFENKGPVEKYAKEMNLGSVPAFIVYSPREKKPIILTGVTSWEEFEEAVKLHLSATKRQ